MTLLGTRQPTIWPRRTLCFHGVSFETVFFYYSELFLDLFFGYTSIKYGDIRSQNQATNHLAKTHFVLSWPSLVHIVVKSRLIRFLNLFFPCTIKLSLAKKIAKFFFYVILVVELHFLFFTKIVFNLPMLIPFVEFSADE